jgi:hypothetical protein
MDIHPPEHPIRSLRDFGMAILTVTCGIIIALGLEGALQKHHDRVLADSARAEFRAEISENRRNIQGQIQEAVPIFDWMQLAVTAAKARLAHQPNQFPAPLASRSFPHLPQNAWDTALATQAIAHMSFSEVRALSTVYAQQTALNDVIARARDQWITLASYGDTSALAALPDETVRKGTGDLLVAYGYTATIVDSEKHLLESYDKAMAALNPDE